MESLHKTCHESDVLSDDEARRKAQTTATTTMLPKEMWGSANSKVASFSKFQQKQRQLFAKQQQQQRRQKPPASPQHHNMKESILKDLRLALSESSSPNMTQSLSKQQQQHRVPAVAAKRVTSIPKLRSTTTTTTSNDSLITHKRHKKRKLPAKNSNQWTSVISTPAWGSDEDSSQDDLDNSDDERQINAGVYLLENTKTGHCYFGTTWDLKNAAAQSFFDLESGSHPHQALTTCFQLYGAAASGIRYRVLERVAAPLAKAPVVALSTTQTCSSRKPGNGDAFDVKKMETLLQRRLAFHSKRRIRKRTLQLVRRLILLPHLQHYWPRWTQFTTSQQTLEREAAATELQRVYRGRLGRKRAVAVRQMRAALQLQRFLRLCVAKRILERRRRTKLEHASANVIQRGVRSFLERRELRRRRLMVVKWLQARRIQTCYRGHRGRRIAARLAQQRTQQAASIRIQKSARGFLARHTAQHRRRQLVGTRAAVYIQRRWRGVLARKAFITRKSAVSEYQRRHHAALKIQSVYGRFLERKLRRVASQYSFQTQQVMTIRMAYKNYVAKKFGWAALTFALESSMATRIQRCVKKWFFLHRLRRLMIDERRERAARTIQRVARGKLGRRHLQVLKQLQRHIVAAKRIQLAWTSRRFLQQLKVVVVQWRRETSACRIQARYRCHHARQLYLVVRTRARRERAAIRLQCMYRSRNARREQHRRLELRRLGVCDDCGDQLAVVYSFSLELELCASCWERTQKDLVPAYGQQQDARAMLDVATYRRLKTQLVVAQRKYRAYQSRLATSFGVCTFCEHKAVRRHCDACGASKRFCHTCSAMFHGLKKDERCASSALHAPISIEAFWVRERAAVLIQKHFRRLLQSRTLLHLRRNIDNANARRIQRAYRTHRQRCITRAQYAGQKQREQDELRAVVFIQSHYRTHLAKQQRRQRALERKSAICIQKALRGRRGRLVAQNLRTRRDAAIMIQRRVRGMHARHLVSVRRQELLCTRQRRAAVCIQRRARGRLARKLLHEMSRNASALAIQMAWRSWKARCELKRRVSARDKRQRELEEALQHAKAARQAEAERKAATRIQSRARQWLARREVHSRRLARARGLRERRRDEATALEFASATRIQQFVRAKWLTKASRQRLPVHCRARQFLSRRVLRRLRVEKHAALKIQRAFRHSRVKRKMETLATGAAELSPWVELFDEASGYVYYYNMETMESSWDKPDGFEGSGAFDQRQGDDEPEWLEYWDENVGASYFYNTKTGEATWTTPEGMDAEEYCTPEESNQALMGEGGGQYGGPEFGGVFRTLPPKAKASMSRRRMRDNQAPEAMFQTAPAPTRSLTLGRNGGASPLASVADNGAPDNWGSFSLDASSVDPSLYEDAYDEAAVDTEYDINYKIFMTQLERDAQQQQQEDELEQLDPDDQQKRQQQDEHNNSEQ